MPLRGEGQHGQRRWGAHLVAWAAACLTLGWLWPQEAPVVRTGSKGVGPSSAAAREPGLSVEVQRLLAQGGCPGWAAVAADAELSQRLDQLPPASATLGAGESPEFTHLLDRGEVRLTSSRHEPGVSQEIENPYCQVEVRPAPRPLPEAPLVAATSSRQPSEPLRLALAAASRERAPENDDEELIPREEDVYRPAREAESSGAKPQAVSTPSAKTKPQAAAPTPSPPPPVVAAPPREEAKPAPDAASRQLLNDDSDSLLEDEDLLQPGLPGEAPAVRPQMPRQDELLQRDDDLLVPPRPTVVPSRPAAVPLRPAPPAAAPPRPSAGAGTTPPAVKPALDKSLFGAPKVERQPSVPPRPGAGGKKDEKSGDGDDDESRCEFVARQLYPSAKECRTCHEQIYDEWSISSHAYAAVSPMFHKFEQKVNDLTQGTMGHFCYRCHTPVGTSLGLSRAMPVYDFPAAAREGVTCVACHRIAEAYGKTNGERRIETGDIYAPVFGSLGGDGVAAVTTDKAKYKVRTSPHEKGPAQDMHAAGLCMPQLAKSEFCASCHQVAVYPGIKLEVVWEQYRASPACQKGIRCQDCHMGLTPGLPSGFAIAPAAVINKRPAYVPRKHSNHVFYGPGYSIAHPGVFPFHPKADRWTMREWLQFDWQAGWGTKEFEKAVKENRLRVAFPETWKEADDRYDAREIIDDNLKKKRQKNELRRQVMENGSHVDGPYLAAPARVGQELKLEYVVTNRNEGHNLPTASLGAQPQLWANVVLVAPDGRRVWESGYLDRLGDLADIHSEDVRQKRIAYDWQLFNLQTMFLITGAKGTDREFFLPVNIDIDPLPFIRPAAQPITVLNHPPFIRMEARSLAPLGVRRVPYRIPGQALCQPGRYRLSFRMRSRTEPIYFMRFCDSTADMQRGMIDGTLDFHEMSVVIDVAN